MDVPRETKPKQRRYYFLGAGVLVLSTVTLASVNRLRPPAPSVERASLLIGTVTRGPMVFQVRGTGTLVPVEVRMITAQVPCNVVRIACYPGTSVQKDSVIAELGSPELQQATEDALWQLRQVEAEYEVSRLNQKIAVDAARANAEEAKAVRLAMERLHSEGMLSNLDLLRAQVKQEEVLGRLAAEEARMSLYDMKDGHVAPSRAKLEQARALYALKSSQRASLNVRAGMTGILQLVPIQVGQQLAPGAILAKVASPLPLKAELKVSETQAKDLQLGQPVSIDTHNGMIKGHVLRIDPSVQNGTVTVDASLEGDLPKGVRPDLSVEGTIELDTVGSGLFVGRPVQAQPHGTLSLFKLSKDGNEAASVLVSLGRGSASTIEVLKGLEPGDQVILSDTTSLAGAERIRLK